MDSNKQDTEEKRLAARCKELYLQGVQERARTHSLERLIHTQATTIAAADIRRAFTEAEVKQLQDSVRGLEADNETLEESVERLGAMHKQQHTVLQEHYGERKRLERENTKLKKILKQRNAKLRVTEEVLTRRTAELLTRPAKKGG